MLTIGGGRVRAVCGLEYEAGEHMDRGGGRREELGWHTYLKTNVRMGGWELEKCFFLGLWL